MGRQGPADESLSGHRYHCDIKGRCVLRPHVVIVISLLVVIPNPDLNEIRVYYQDEQCNVCQYRGTFSDNGPFGIYIPTYRNNHGIIDDGSNDDGIGDDGTNDDGTNDAGIDTSGNW
jgi:hypothetical protein